jgi:hypothetical protein
MLFCNAVVPQLFWFQFARRNVWLMFAACLLVNVGMWFERFVIIVSGLHRDFLPSSWGSYYPSWVEVATLIGSFGLFLTLFLLFCRYLPMVAMAEVKGILPGSQPGHAGPVCRTGPEDGAAGPARQAGPAAEADGKLWGLLAQYPDAAALSAAAVRVRDAGYKRWDCCTPYPIHGLDWAMGVRRTVLPWFVLAAGLAGCALALGMQWYVNSPHAVNADAGVFSSYPLVFGGKPYWSLPAHIPVAFELAVLFASLAAFFGLWGLTRLPRLYFPAFASRRFRKVTDDGFFLIIETKDKKFDLAETTALLSATGSSAIEEIEP